MANKPDSFAADSPTSRTNIGSGGAQTASGSYGSTALKGTEAGTRQQQPAAGQRGDSGVTEHAKQALSDTTGQAAQKVVSRLDTQKDKAAVGLGSIAQALRQTGDQLRNEAQGSAINDYISTAADQVERFSGYLRSTNTREIVHRVEDFARQQPALFLGSALLIGVLGARFLKSSGRASPSQSGQTQGYGYTGTTDAYGQSAASPQGSAATEYRGTSDRGQREF